MFSSKLYFPHPRSTKQTSSLDIYISIHQNRNPFTAPWQLDFGIWREFQNLKIDHSSLNRINFWMHQRYCFRIFNPINCECKHTSMLNTLPGLTALRYMRCLPNPHIYQWESFRGRDDRLLYRANEWHVPFGIPTSQLHARWLARWASQWRLYTEGCINVAAQEYWPNTIHFGVMTVCARMESLPVPTRLYSRHSYE